MSLLFSSAERNFGPRNQRSDYLHGTGLFLYGLFCGAVIHKGVVRWSVNDKWERIGKKAIAVISWHLCVRTEENREITQWCCGRDSNRIPAEHKPIYRCVYASLLSVGQFVLRVFIWECSFMRTLLTRTYGESSDIPQPCGYLLTPWSRVLLEKLTINFCR